MPHRLAVGGGARCSRGQLCFFVLHCCCCCWKMGMPLFKLLSVIGCMCTKLLHRASPLAERGARGAVGRRRWQDVPQDPCPCPARLPLPPPRGLRAPAPAPSFLCLHNAQRTTRTRTSTSKKLTFPFTFIIFQKVISLLKYNFNYIIIFDKCVGVDKTLVRARAKFVCVCVCICGLLC